MISRSDFKANSKQIIDWIDQYFQKIETLPVKSQVRPKDIYNQIPEQAPDLPESFDQILKDLDEIILPGITHWQHPNFHAYFPANSSVESLYGEFITSAIAAQCMIWESSPAAAELEERMMEWLRDAMGLPSHFEGVIHDTASTATLVAILTAREVATNFTSNEDGVPPGLRIYCSAETHSSIDKAVGIAGIGKKNLIKIPVDSDNAMIPELLREQIIEDMANNLTPCCVIASIGTTGTVAIDPLKEIADICDEKNVWLHVDAAYAGNVLILPEYRHYAEGMDLANSFVFNPHKWLLTNFDCSVYFVKDVQSLIRTFEILPEYLKTKTRGQVNDYRDWGVQLGRRFRALKLWFVMRGVGLEGLRSFIRKHIELNQYFIAQLEKRPEIEIVGKPVLNFSCFRQISPSGSEEEANILTEALLTRMNATGKVFVTQTKTKGKYVIRVVIGQAYLEKKHVDKLLQTIDICIKSH